MRPQHLEVLRDRGLADAELRADVRRDLPRGPLPRREDLEDPPPDRVAEDVERFHVSIMEPRLI
ncbi:hypothetical protein BJF88_06645 [Cellulosimicrobium sp. CUA-896]|nr:hypothetical protein BJF88_06645 [Cellulosimicrobium sp. CUA-896]